MCLKWQWNKSKIAFGFAQLFILKEQTIYYNGNSVDFGVKCDFVAYLIDIFLYSDMKNPQNVPWLYKGP